MGRDRKKAGEILRANTANCLRGEAVSEDVAEGPQSHPLSVVWALELWGYFERFFVVGVFAMEIKLINGHKTSRGTSN